MNPVLLTSHAGTLSFTPPTEEVAAQLRKELSFKHTFTVVEPAKRWDARLGMMVATGRAKRQFRNEIETLYVETEEGVFVTHDGMLRRVSRVLDQHGVPHAYEHHGTPWPRPLLTPDVFRGLDAPQREATVRLLLSVGGGMAEAPTGYGKTRPIAALVRAYPGLRILILTKATSVVRGLHRELGAMLAEDGVEVGIYGGGQKNPKAVTVSTVASAGNFDPELVDVLIVDEVHTTTGDSSSGKILQFNRGPRYGLSGSLKPRFDGKEAWLEACFGPIVYRTTDQETQERGRVCPVHVYFLAVDDGPEVESLSETSLKRHAFWRNHYRNALAARAVANASADQQLLIFVETLEHLEWLLANELRGMGFEVCHGELPPEEREDIERRFTFGECKRLIATDCLSTGVDPKNLRIMIDLSGVKGDAAMYQKRGRLRRWAPGKTYGVLVQFDDAWSPKLARKAAVRRKEYEANGDTIVDHAQADAIVFDQGSPEEEASAVDGAVEQTNSPTEDFCRNSS